MILAEIFTLQQLLMLAAHSTCHQYMYVGHMAVLLAPISKGWQGNIPVAQGLWQSLIQLCCMLSFYRFVAPAPMIVGPGLQHP